MAVVTARQAIQAATTKLNEYFDKPVDVLVEEVDSNGQYWFITLGLRVKRAPNTVFEKVHGFDVYERVYRVFEVAKSSGKVKRMRMREER